MKDKIFIVPEPKRIDLKNKWFPFDGFQNFPSFLLKEFNIPEGSWKIRKIEKDGTGIRIKEGEIEMWGEENICYATIIQILKENNNLLPEVEIEEKFHFSFRGYHLDIARGGVPTLNTFKKILRWLFLLKYNYFAIYFEDLFPWRKYPQIGKLRGRLEEEELKEIIYYGRSLGIEVFPSLELCGHMENILVLSDFSRFSEWHRPQEGCLDVSNKEAREFAYELLDDVIKFFPSTYIHIGGDETWALGRGRSLDKTGVFEGPQLFEMHHKNLINMVKESGKVPIVWGDMMTGMYLRKEEKEKWRAVLESDIWEETIVANWDYTNLSEEHFESKINLFGKRKEKEIACPGVSNWNRYYPNFEIALGNIRNFLRPARKEKLPGFLLTSWGDDGAECLYSFLDPLILANMEIAEGSGNWEEKWLALSGEKREVLEARKMLGESIFSETIKHVFLGTQTYRYYLEILKDKVKERKSTGNLWADYYSKMIENLANKELLLYKYGEILEKVSDINLPEDLELMRDMLRIGIKRLKGTLNFLDFIEFGNKYARLWLSERKRENLEVVISKIFGTGGRADLKIF
ncbi:MAG TPA: beta-N-acetylhexosaminidase [Clostridia bacterium]|nr:beta-N-acetylhexosaminidase [Clostridia bacterium]